MPGARLVGNYRKMKAAEAYNHHIERLTHDEIAPSSELSRPTVATLIAEHREEVAANLDGTERMTAIGTYNAVIKESFRSL